MELRHYLTLLRRWWGLIFLLALLGGGAALGLYALTPPVYESSTTILINQAPGALPDFAAVTEGQRLAFTYAELIQQRPVLEEVIANLELTSDPDTLLEQVEVSPIPNTNLLVVTVRDADPGRAAAVANEIVTVFIRQNLEFQESRYAETLQNLEAEINRTEEDIADAESQLDRLGTPGSDAAVEEHNRLQDLLAQYRTTLATLQSSRADVQLAMAQTSDKVSIVEQAVPGTLASEFGLLIVTAEGAVAGIIVGVVLAFVLESLRDSVRGAEEAEKISGAPTMALIGRIPDAERGKSLVTAFKPRSPIAEAYRVLRANIEFSAVDAPINIIAVTSSGPLEGKTTTTANLAVAIAQSGRLCLLMDGDLRRPSLHKVFGVPNTRGVTSALTQFSAGPVTDHIVHSGIENLYLMPSGPIPPNPAELLGSQRMSLLIDELRSRFDTLVFDTPPVLAVVDATLLARKADATLMVVLTDSTKASALKKAGEQVAQAGARLIGVVLNKASTRDGYYYYYDYSPRQQAHAGSGSSGGKTRRHKDETQQGIPGVRS